jgi:hypothetical protein
LKPPLGFTTILPKKLYTRRATGVSYILKERKDTNRTGKNRKQLAFN